MIPPPSFAEGNRDFPTRTGKGPFQLPQLLINLACVMSARGPIQHTEQRGDVMGMERPETGCPWWSGFGSSRCSANKRSPNDHPPPLLACKFSGSVVVGSKGLGRDVPGFGCAGEMGEVGMLSAARTGSFKKKGPLTWTRGEEKSAICNNALPCTA